MQSVTDRLRAAADKLGLTAEQGWRIVDTPKNFDGKYETLADDRREVLRFEPKVVGEILTPNQRDTVRNDFQGHAVVDIRVDPNDLQAVAVPKETIAERLEGTAEKLGLTEEQRDKISAIDPGLAAKCTAQREALRGRLRRAMTRTHGSLEREPHGARRAEERSSRVVAEIRLKSEFVEQENVEL